LPGHLDGRRKSASTGSGCRSGIDNLNIRHLTSGEAKVDLNFERITGRVPCYLDQRHESLVPLVVKS
jgi:hypothetical protein